MVTSVAVTKGNYIISSWSKERSIHVFDLVTNQEVHCFSNVHESEPPPYCIFPNLFLLGEIISLVVTSDSKYIISGSSDRSIKIFDLTTKKEVHHFRDVDSSKIPPYVHSR